MGLAAGFAVVGIFSGCSKTPEPVRKVDVQTSSTLWMNPLAIVVPGENPLWFELSDDGPLVISSPEEASLRTFRPWPHSIHIKDMLIQKNRLVMAVNRLGFLAIIPWDDSRLGIYSVFDTAYWSKYSIASLFIYDETPSALLYRDDFFFSDENVSLPETPVMGLVKGNIAPIRAEIPAFKDFPSAKDWDIEALNRSKNGDWYFIAAQKSSDIREKFYYQAESLEKAPSSISMGDYWLAMEPESLRNAPLLLKNAAEAAINSRSSDFSYLIEAISPNNEYEFRYFYNSSEKSDMISLFSYYNDDKAIAVFHDGTGAVSEKYADNSIETQLFSLPKLPKDFFYTGVTLSGNTIIASWEEQQFYGVGAAGFVVVEHDILINN
jgi:hypothetical protein